MVEETERVKVPEDTELKKIIDKLANFVARNGPKFEELTKTKQNDNPKFSFLFGGDYHAYYKHQVAEEKNIQTSSIQLPVSQQNVAPWQQPPGQHDVQQGQQQIPMFQPPPQPEAHIQAPPQPPSDLVLSEFEELMKKIMDSCTKDNISNGKAWIFTNAKSSHHCKHIAQHMQHKIKEDLKFQQKLHLVYLINDVIHHCARKGSTDLLKAFGDVIVVIFALTHHGESSENQEKLAKVYRIWEKNNFFDPSVMEKLKSPDTAFTEYEAQQKALQEQQQQRQMQQQQSQAQPGQPLQQPPTSSGQAGFFDYGHGQPQQQFPYTTWPDQYNQYYQQYNQFPPMSQPYMPGYQYQQYPFPQQPPMMPPHPQVQDRSSEKTSQPGTSSDASKAQLDREVKVSGEQDDSQSGSKPDDGSAQVQRDGSTNLENNESAPGQPQGFPGQGFAPMQHMPPGAPGGFQGGRFPPQPGFFQGQGPQEFSHPPPGFHDPRFPPQGPPQMGFQGPVQQFDYGHQRRPGFDPNAPPPPLSFDYDHGRRMGDGPPPPEHDPTIPLAPYYDLPAGLMVPLIKLWDCEYKPIDPKDLRLPIPQPPSERLIAAVEAFYSPPSHDRPRDSQGWEKNGLFEYFKAKLKFIKDKPRNIEIVERSPSPPAGRKSRSRSRSGGRGRRSRSGSLPYQRTSVSPPYQRRSNSPPYQRKSTSPPSRRKSESPPYQRRSASRSPYQRRSRSKSPYQRRSRSKSPIFRRSRSRSRSRSKSPRRRVSRSRSRSLSPRNRKRHGRSRSKSPVGASLSPRRSPTPPSGFVMFESKSMDSKIEESNVGHQLLKKMGWGGEGLGRKGQGIQEPIKGGEIREKQDQFKGIGIELNDPFEQYRRNKSYTFNRPRK